MIIQIKNTCRFLIEKVPVLLSLIGRNTYALLRNLVAPASPKDKSFKELTEQLTSHFEPKPLVIAERFNFYRRSQQSGETIAEYVAGLRRLALHCEFADFLDQAPCDRFVCGLRSESTQKALLTEDHKKLTLSKAIEKAQCMEAADTKAKEFKGSPTSVLKVTPPAPVVPNPKKACYRCGQSNHDQQACRFRQATCHSCGKVGHIAPVCRSRKPTSTRRSRPKQPTPTPKAKWVDVEASDSEEAALFTIGEKTTNPISVEVKVNGRNLSMELDTGAAVSIMSNTTRKAVFPRAKVQPCSVNLRTYTGEVIKVVGELSVVVQHGHLEAKKIPLIIVEGDGPPLLGRNWLEHVQLDWKVIKALSLPSEPKKNLDYASTRRCSETNLDTYAISTPSLSYDQTQSQSFLRHGPSRLP